MIIEGCFFFSYCALHKKMMNKKHIFTDLSDFRINFYKPCIRNNDSKIFYTPDQGGQVFLATNYQHLDNNLNSELISSFWCICSFTSMLDFCDTKRIINSKNYEFVWTNVKMKVFSEAASVAPDNNRQTIVWQEMRAESRAEQGGR